ncbi:ankyrin repeat-containing domain protein [Aspergillus crustosus]
MTGSRDYTVGWICALPFEYVAAQSCLDEEYENVSVDLSETDNNEYTLGRIAKHNVVIAVLPKGGHGMTSATAVAKDMLHSFPGIRIGLMVGIGGGVPTKHDIRLGDVIVSAPQDGKSGVFQYDFGKSIQDQTFVYTGVLDQPPVPLQRTQFEGTTKIHYGIIASGNQLIKDAVIRDKLSREKDILCFEMEAAGLMNHFPCAIIRGISDYSDSHKNDRWQKYAALTAALYTKDLLSKLSPHKTIAEKRMEYNTILNWFTSFDHGLPLSDHRSRRAPKTGGWFLESAEFKRWLTGTKQMLFCPGIPGAGKTMIASTVVDHLYRIFQEDNSVGVAIAFLDNLPRAPNTELLQALLQGLLKQLIPNPVPDVVTELYEYHSQKNTRPHSGEVFTTLCKVIERYSRTFIVIDALDEIPLAGGNRSKIIRELFNIQDAVCVNIAVMSRPISEIVESFEERRSIQRDIRASDGDVRRFITSEILNFQAWVREADGLERKITDTVIEATDGMFLLARLHLDTLRQETTITNISRMLENLPAGSMAYHEAYANIMARINNQPEKHRKLAHRVLSWVTQAHRPIRVSELQHALAVTDCSSEFDEGSIPHLSLIVEVCAGLIDFRRNLEAIQLVHYTASEYFEQCWQSWFPEANEYMATALIKYLSFDRFSVRPAQTWKDYHEWLEINCLYEYAACYWGEHAREAYPQVKGMVAGFLRSATNLLNSVHVLSLKDQLLFGGLQIPQRVNGLHVAAYFGIIEQIRTLIGEREDLDVADDSGQTALHWAIKNGQRQAVEILSDEGLNVNALNQEFESPLHYAACQGSKIEARDSAGDTPLLVAARSVNLGALKGLLTRAANPRALDNMDRNVLHLTITANKQDRAEALELLLSYGSEFRLCDADNMTPLHYAVAQGDCELIDLLLEAGADINMGVQRKFGKNTRHPICINAGLPPVVPIQDVDDLVGLTPLHFAACAGNSKMTEYLLRKGANPNARCYCLDTPLHVALRRGLLDEQRDRRIPKDLYILPNHDAWIDDRWQVEIVRDHISDYGSEEADKILRHVEEQRSGVVSALLESPTIEVNAENIQLNSPLHIVRFSDPSSPVIVSTLAELGANVFTCNSKGQSVLHLACKANVSSIVNDLLDRGCSIDTTDYQSLNALHTAVRAGSCDTVRTIFSRDESLAESYCLSVDAEGQNLLHHYLQADSSLSEMVLLLLSYGAKVNGIDNKGHTPLSVYLGTFKWGDRVETCRLLLKHGANALWTGPDGRNLAHIAVHNHKTELGVLEALAQYGLNLSMKDKSGKGILHHGAIGGSISVEVTTFLCKQILLDLYDRDGSGRTPLHYASEAANKELSQDTFGRYRWKQTLETLQSFC